MAPAAVYQDNDAHEEPDVTPRPSRTTDAATLTLPIAWVWVIVAAIVGIAVNQTWQLSGMRSDIRESNARIEERQKATDETKELTQRYFDQRFQLLESKIESAGLRNAALAMSQQLDKQNGKR